MGGTILEIERLERPSRARFERDYVATHTPVIIRGAVDDWPARTRWTPAYFRERCGDRLVDVEVWDDGLPGASMETQLRHRVQQMPLSEYVDLIASGDTGKKYYLAQQALEAVAPELLGDIAPLDYYPEWIRRLVQPVLIFFGPKGTVTPYHYDPTHNLLVQVKGRKQVVMVSPDQSRLLYHPWKMPGFDRYNYSPVDPTLPDPERFPLYETTTRYEFVLEEGEALFIPIGWWHHVRSLAPSINVTFWWVTLPMLMRMAPKVYGTVATNQARRLLGRPERDPYATLLR